MKQISEVVFRKIMSNMTGSLTAERLSAILDATPDEGMDVLFLGRLESVEIVNLEEFEKCVRKLLTGSYSGKKADTIYNIAVKVYDTAKFRIYANYKTKDSEEVHTWWSENLLATDERFTSYLKFTYKD